MMMDDLNEPTLANMEVALSRARPPKVIVRKLRRAHPEGLSDAAISH
jgi:hypothetical protein